MESVLMTLAKEYGGREPEKVELLPASGSARKYYRFCWGEHTCIAAWNADRTENRLFLDFSKHFRAKRLPVPEIYRVSADGLAYLQEDLGPTMLLQVAEQERTAEGLSRHTIELYRKALSALLRFQWQGGEGLDYTRCVPRAVFDRRCIGWDLYYFKYCFLRLAGAVFSEDALEDDFERLTETVCQQPTEHFMFRDFQSRNILVRDEEVWFIDYQGGRQGALPYDVASLLYDAAIDIPERQKEQLLDFYIARLQTYQSVEPSQFRAAYYPFVLVRLLQAMGAFGLRGLYERKPHFIASIEPGLKNIETLFVEGKLGEAYPEIRKVVTDLRKNRSFTLTR